MTIYPFAALAEVIKQTRFKSAAELESTLKNEAAIYNHHIPQRALDHLSPIPAMKKWQTERPELFVELIHNQRELDN